MVDEALEPGWWFMAFVSKGWRPFKFSTVTKERRAQQMLKTLRDKHRGELRFKLVRGYRTIGETNEETEAGSETEN